MVDLLQSIDVTTGRPISSCTM